MKEDTIMISEQISHTNAVLPTATTLASVVSPLEEKALVRSVNIRVTAHL